MQERGKMETENSKKSESSEKLKMAIAVALLKSKLLLQKNNSSNNHNTNNGAGAVSSSADPPPPNSRSDDHDSLKWKRKAKERKREILRLQEDLKLAEDGMQYDLFPQNAACKCYFYDNMGILSDKQLEDRRFNDVLRRRFLRQVRIKERKRRRDASFKQHVPGTNSDNEIEQLSSSVDFLVELCDAISPTDVEDQAFKNWSHQAVDFILMGDNREIIEGIISGLVMRLLRRTCNGSHADDSQHTESNACFYVQHLIRKLGSEAYVGQRIILSVSQGICTAAESLLFMDPFDDAFPNMHNCMYMMIQLIQFLVSDYLLNWSEKEDLEMGLFEDWVSSLLHARKALEILESRNGLYVLYIDRVIGDVAKKAGQSSLLQRLKPNVCSSLFS
ncbi:protein MULTIPOLAR SPINDLE 1 isoform X2 [Coffea arabica]|uniref:Protein MULTIPOLAR SPINDLE 1 isoform X2 n=1 Tax=Coffea arabica TaxID=13443 RepID=A0A6P6SVJ2_COFAR|nr:protein MULTIPOLAR SPINDLE 1-like isoform X2 [Coffea arabica]